MPRSISTEVKAASLWISILIASLWKRRANTTSSLISVRPNTSPISLTRSNHPRPNTQRGLMVHSVPAQGMFNHGLINYNFKFFWMLARSNGYKFIHADYITSRELYNLPTNISDFIFQYDSSAMDRTHHYRASDSMIFDRTGKDVRYFRLCLRSTSRQAPGRISSC